MNCPKCNASDKDNLVVKALFFPVTNPLGMHKFNDLLLPLEVNTLFLLKEIKGLIPTLPSLPITLPPTQVPTRIQVCFGCGFKKIILFAQ